MSQTNATKRSVACDECGARDVKIARVYKGLRYCQTCYKRMFKRRLCPGCGNFARLPIRFSHAVCQSCERRKPCVRCGRVGRKIGKLTAYGPACNSCAPYYREPESCEACGELSTRLSRKASLGHDLRVCQRCARSDHKTCEACRHHRPLIESPDGRRLCAVCLEKGEIPCPKCGQPMPAGRGQECWTCYWTTLAEARVQKDCGAFSSSTLTEYFQAFGTWLIQRVGGQKAALTIHGYLEFFLEIERKWQGIPDYETLVRHFSAGGLRRYLLPMRWMEASRLVTPDAAKREADSDQRRIQASLDKFPEESRERTILNGYYEYLMQRVEKSATTLRSVRLAISPAASLLAFVDVMDRMPPDQKALDGFLRQTPGQRAALSGFVKYLREKHGVEMTLLKNDPHRAYRKRRKKLEAEMLTLMHEAGNDRERKRRWLCLALAYFHDLPLKTGQSVSDKDITADENGMTIRIGGGGHWIPRPNAG